MGIAEKLINAGKKAVTSANESYKKEMAIVNAKNKREADMALARKTAYDHTYKRAYNRELLKAEKQMARKKARSEAMKIVKESRSPSIAVKQSDYVTLAPPQKSRYGTGLNW